MICHICGGKMNPISTDMPFKLRDTAIVIIKALPVIQCEACCEYMLEDSVMKQVEGILNQADSSIEFEVVKFAA